MAAAPRKKKANAKLPGKIRRDRRAGTRGAIQLYCTLAPECIFLTSSQGCKLRLPLVNFTFHVKQTSCNGKYKTALLYNLVMSLRRRRVTRVRGRSRLRNSNLPDCNYQMTKKWLQVWFVDYVSNVYGFLNHFGFYFKPQPGLGNGVWAPGHNGKKSFMSGW